MKQQPAKFNYPTNFKLKAGFDHHVETGLEANFCEIIYMWRNSDCLIFLLGEQTLRGCRFQKKQ